MYLKITATGPRAEQIASMLGSVPERLAIDKPPHARLRLIVETGQPGSVLFTVLAYPEPAAGWDGSPAELQVGDYVKSRLVALSPLFRAFLDGAFGAALAPVAESELARRKFELHAELAPLTVSYRNPHIRTLFEPLGYRVELESPVFGLPAILLRLQGQQSLVDLMHHLFVLVPALDEGKQTPLNRAELRRLIGLSMPWLATHPKRGFVARSYHLKLSQLLGQPSKTALALRA